MRTFFVAAIAAFGAELLIVSFGADTHAGDPISAFMLQTLDHAVLAADIAALGLPTVIVIEGGHAVDALGANAASFLAGFEPSQARRANQAERVVTFLRQVCDR